MAMTPGDPSWLSNALSPFALDHTTHMSLAILSPLFTANRVILPSSTQLNYSSNTTEIMKRIDEKQVNCLLANPTILRDMLSHLDSPSSSSSLTSLRYVYCAGRIAGRDLIEEAMKRLNLEFLCNSYGTSETLNVSMCLVRKQSIGRAIESVGRPRPLIECKVVNRETGQTEPVNTDGELCVRSFCLMKCYLGDAVKTRACIDDHRW